MKILLLRAMFNNQLIIILLTIQMLVLGLAQIAITTIMYVLKEEAKVYLMEEEILTLLATKM